MNTCSIIIYTEQMFAQPDLEPQLAVNAKPWDELLLQF